MNNVQRLRQAFANSLGIGESEVTDDLKYNTIPRWDSVAHMALVAEIENTFDIMFDTSDVLGMSSFKEAVAIIKRLGIDVDEG